MSETANVTYTQAQLEELLQADRQKHKQLLQEEVSRLSELQSQLNLTATQKAELEERLTSLQKVHESSRETLAREKKVAEEALKRTQEENAKAAKMWQERHNHLLIGRELTEQAVSSGAINPGIITQLLASHAHIVPEVDESGQPKEGQFKVLINWQGKERTAQDVVSEMQESDDYRMLFAVKKVGGLGATTSDGRMKADPWQVANDAVAKRRFSKSFN